MNKESRRNFVKKTAVLSTATLATTLPVDSFANVTDNKKLNKSSQFICVDNICLGRY